MSAPGSEGPKSANADPGEEKHWKCVSERAGSEALGGRGEPRRNPTLSAIQETGVIKKPSVFVMAKIAKALNITLDDLLK